MPQSNRKPRLGVAKSNVLSFRLSGMNVELSGKVRICWGVYRWYLGLLKKHQPPSKRTAQP